MSQQSKKKKLKELILALESYQIGCKDTFHLIEEQHHRTMDFYDKKIFLLEKELKNES